MVDEVVIAYHEAGHAVLAETVGARVLSVTIIPPDDAGPRRHGETTIAWHRPAGAKAAKKQLLSQARVALAGPVAEMIYCDTQYEVEVIQEWAADWLVASNSIQHLNVKATDRDILHLLGQLMEELIQWMSQDDIWHRVATLADELEAHEILDEERLDELRSLGWL